MALNDVDDMLRCLFRDNSLQYSACMPFCDLGFVYRSLGDNGHLMAFPLCLASEKALLQIWGKITSDRPILLSECIERSKDDDFEILVFETLVKKLTDASGSQYLPCLSLGLHFEERIPVRLDFAYTATCTPEDAAADIVRVRRIAANKNLTVLYRCPKNTETIDFCILSASMVLAIRVSLLSLTQHEKPDATFLESIGASTGVHQTRNCDWRYVYITTNPEFHPLIASRKHWWGVEVGKIRLVNASSWIQS